MPSTDILAGVNPVILIWARQRAGLDIQDVAQALHRQPEEIESWERGAGAPTYSQLEKLAYKVFKRPIAIFFFPAPPDEPAPEHSFRTLPDFEIDQLSAEVRFLVRDGLAKQEALIELAGPTNPTSTPVFKEVHLTPDVNPVSAAEIVREKLGVSVVEQKEFRSIEEALKRWRSAIEECGVFVFKNAFGSENISGFCLYDKEFPVIYLNNSTAKSRQIFTLIHELAHILLATGGVTKVDDSYIRALRGRDRHIEIFCNRFAGEFLVPSADLRAFLKKSNLDDESIFNMAQAFSVSREVVLRRTLDLGFMSANEYERKTVQWNAEYLGRKKGTGVNYYATKATYLGTRFLNLAFRRFYEGFISKPQLADYLGIKVGSLAGLEDFLVQGTAA